MIGNITGEVGSKGIDWMLVHTSGGVGYKIFTTHDILSQCSSGQTIEVLTYLVVREDQLTLYGFQTAAQLNFFTQLISISGVGPKSALGILNAGKVEELTSAIGKSDVAIFTTISGIGQKTAERIIIDLKNKVDLAAGETTGDTHDLMTALTALGYNAYEVRNILSQIPKQLDNTEDRIKYALQLLGK